MASRLIDPQHSALVIIDFQARLMPHIEGGDTVLANARRLIEAARLLPIAMVITEQNADGLGHTVPELPIADIPVIAKQTFGSCATPAFVDALREYRDIVIVGCEAHVCVLQTVMGLIELNRRVFVVRDAVGARSLESKETALARMARAGADIVTTEMVVFEWLRTSDHPAFKASVRLVK